MTEEFVNYIRPLIQAELTPIMTGWPATAFVLYGCGEKVGIRSLSRGGMGKSTFMKRRGQCLRCPPPPGLGS